MTHPVDDYRFVLDMENALDSFMSNSECAGVVRAFREMAERAERQRLLDAIEAARSEFELRNVIAKERAK